MLNLKLTLVHPSFHELNLNLLTIDNQKRICFFVRKKKTRLHFHDVVVFLCLVTATEPFLISLKGCLEHDGFAVLPSLYLDQSPLLLCLFSFNLQINTLFSDSVGNLFFSGSNLLPSFLNLLISSCSPQTSACMFLSFASDDKAFFLQPST